MSSQPDTSPKQRPTRRRDAPRWRSLPWLLLTLVPIVAFAVGAWQRRWMSDDGFINVRIVHNILDGFGPVFNVGERIEAHTSTLWVALTSIPSALGVPVEYAAVYGGIGLSIAALALAAWTASALHREPGDETPRFAGVLPVGLVIYAAIPAAWDYASSGLETGLALFWMALCFTLITRVGLDDSSAQTQSAQERPDSHFYATGFVLGLGPLVRPELALYSFTFLACLLLAFFHRERGGFSFKKLVLLGVAMGALPVGYQLFRMGYYAALVPNTAYAKEAFESRWTQGGHYFDHFFGLYELLFPMALAAVLWISAVVREASEKRWRRLSLVLLPTLCGIAYTVYVVKVGGGFMHGRLFLPPVFGTLLTVMVVRLRPQDTPPAYVGARALVFALIVGWAVYCATSIRVARENVHGIGDERGWWTRLSGIDNPITADDFAKTSFHRDAVMLRKMAKKQCPAAFGEGDTCEPVVYARPYQGTKFGKLFPSKRTYPLRDKVAKRKIGVAAQRTAMGIRGTVVGPHVHVVDHVGLSDPLSSHLKIEKRGRPGHEKSLSDAWMVARFAEPVPGEDPRIQTARRVLQCGRLAELLEAVQAPLTFGRFFGNMSAAFRFHTLRVPPDPFVAEQELCGAEPPHVETIGGRGGTEHQWRCGPAEALAGFDVSDDKKSRALGWLRPRCVGVEKKGDAYKLSGRHGKAPGFGKLSFGKSTPLECPHGKAVVGIAGGKGSLIERMSAVCAQVDFDADEHGATTRTREVGSGGEDFELMCPAGTVATGVVTRSGHLIDAVGLMCSTPQPADASADAAGGDE
ncbi:hypothetical protein FIV42_18790 [Persicimonas caeni]|uniref:Terminal beta-(1->2)-arabinofuranosyltransferase C-terminal domain-containing protein n=1 Tax=Persicimonas caeni TaxID=2292766 RepID=A0A4Y6PWJ8_PERCE|nr:hypothetical protein [Persicimonas caeni]QDG52711.1 hypothetical protein FIV42_18790 [Persicimonas caeni]QED33933.1 hypothetical protein FRD00_18785 [Persicimonas caeni]